MKLKPIKMILVLSALVILIAGVSCPSCAKETKPNLPSDIPANLRGEIEKLFSKNSTKRGRAAQCLAGMGAAAVPAVPFLGNLLGERAPARPFHERIMMRVFDLFSPFASYTVPSVGRRPQRL